MGLKKFLKQHGIEVEDLGDRIVFRSSLSKKTGMRHQFTQNPAPTLPTGVLGVPSAFPGDGIPLMPESGPPFADQRYVSWGFENAPAEDSEPQPKKGVLIGLGGYLRNGKDAVADVLVEDREFQKFGMSDPLNEALLVLNPWIPDWTSASGSYAWKRYREVHDGVGYVEAKKNPEVRRLLQMLGTDVGRNMIDPYVWTAIAQKKIQEQLDQGKNVVITAIRFPNEVDMVREMGGTLLWVTRPGKEYQPKADAHASETSVSEKNFGYTFVNDGDLSQLKAGVLRFHDEVLGQEAYDGITTFAASDLLRIRNLQEGSGVQLHHGALSNQEWLRSAR